MAVMLNAASIQAIEAGVYPFETTITVYDENGAGIELPYGNMPDTDGQVTDAQVEVHAQNGGNYRLSLTVNLDATLRAVLLKYRTVVVTTAIRAVDGTIAQYIGEFKGKFRDLDALEALDDEGIVSATMTLQAYGAMKDLEEATVDRQFNPSNVASPASGYWNLTPILRRAALRRVGKSVGANEPVPLPTAYDPNGKVPTDAPKYAGEFHTGITVLSCNTGTITASNSLTAQAFAGSFDGILGSLDGSTQGEANPFVQITFASAQTIDSIKIFPHQSWPWTTGTISFSDGSSVAMPTTSAGGAPYTLTFAAKTGITWVKFSAVSALGPILGIGDIAIMNAGALVASQPVRSTIAWALGPCIAKTTNSGSGATVVEVNAPRAVRNGDMVSLNGANAVSVTPLVYGSTLTQYQLSSPATWSVGQFAYNVFAPSATGTTLFNEINWGSAFPTRDYELDVWYVDRLVITKGDAYVSSQTQGPLPIYLADGQEPEDLPNLSKTAIRTTFTTTGGSQVMTVDSTAEGFYVGQPVVAINAAGVRVGGVVTAIGSATSITVTLNAVSSTTFTSGLASLQDFNYLDYYKGWDPQKNAAVAVRLDSSTIKTISGSRFQPRAADGFMKWSGGGLHFSRTYWLVTDAAPVDPDAAGNQAEAFLSTVLQSDVGIATGSIDLGSSGVTLRAVSYHDSPALEVLNQLRGNVFPPTYLVTDTRDGKIKGSQYAQLSDGNAGIVTLHTFKSSSYRDQLPLQTATRVRSPGAISRNVAPISAVWLNNGSTRSDLLFDGDTQNGCDLGSTAGNRLIAIFKVNSPLEKLRIFYQGVISVAIDASAAMAAQASGTIGAAYQVSRFHPRIIRQPNYQNGTGAWLEEADWLQFEPSYPYYLWIYGEPLFDDAFSNLTPGSARANLKIWEIELWQPDQVDVWARMCDNSATFPLPSDAYSVAGFSTFADRGASNFGSAYNWWYSPSKRSYYRYAPPDWLKRNALNYAAGIHRVNKLQFPGISATTAGSYAMQTQNELVRRTAPLDVRCVWEPVDEGDTIRIPDGSLRIVMGKVVNVIDKSMTLETYDYAP